MPRLIAYDRVIDSAVPLPGALSADNARDPDWAVSLECSDNVPPFTRGCRWNDQCLTWSLNPAEQHLVMDRQLSLQTFGPVNGQAVSENAIANGLPALSWIAGAIVLHAAAVVMPQCHSAIAIVAPSGGGKSTLLNQLMRAGAILLADDTLVLRREGSRWIGSGLPGGWFMRVDGQIERGFVTAPAGRSRQRAPVAAILALTLADDGQLPCLQRQRGIAALSLLLAHRHRPQVPRAMGNEASYLPSLAAIAAELPIYGLTRQRGRIRLTDAELAAMADLANDER